MSLPEGTPPETKQISSAETLPLTYPHIHSQSNLTLCEKAPPRTPGGPLGQLRLSQLPGRNERAGPVSPHLALLGFCPKDFCGGRALSQKQTQRVLLQAHVPDGPGRLPSLLPGVDKHQHLSRSPSLPQSRDTTPTVTPTPLRNQQKQRLHHYQAGN